MAETGQRTPQTPNEETQGQATRRLALIVEYDGTHYAGFQIQQDQPTIQGAIEQALTNFTGEQIRIRGASRTDAGAHATGQVVDFLTRASYPVGIFPRALNYYLPPDIKVQAAFQVTLDFHSRISAASRIYRYRILNRTWPSPLGRQTQHWVREKLNTDSMFQAAQYLVGVHDFRPLALSHPLEKSAVRQVMRWEVRQEQETIVIDCEANGFLKHQIRRANAILVEVGKGKWPTSIVKDTLDHKLPEGLVWPALPARGLCLMQVTYLNFWDKVKATDETD